MKNLREIGEKDKSDENAIYILGCSDLILFLFYHLGAFHDLDLLVLRPLKKKKGFSRTPHRGHARSVHRFQNAQSH